MFYCSNEGYKYLQSNQIYFCKFKFIRRSAWQCKCQQIADLYAKIIMETSLFVIEYGVLEYLQSNIIKYVISFDSDLSRIRIYNSSIIWMLWVCKLEYIALFTYAKDRDNSNIMKNNNSYLVEVIYHALNGTRVTSNQQFYNHYICIYTYIYINTQRSGLRNVSELTRIKSWLCMKRHL